MVDDPRRILLLRKPWRIACVVLNIAPIPGVGAIIAGARNPHSRLLSAGIAQLLLVVLGSFPWILPGAVGLAWAIWTSVRIHRDSVDNAPWSAPV